MLDDGLLHNNDGQLRCWWCGHNADYIRYHDEEWGYPVTDNIRLFEKICLEGFQAGLSWLTILRKRDNFRQAFSGFDFHAIAKFDENNIVQLLANAGIIRHRGKIVSTINNAHRAIDLIEEFGSLATYFWRFEPSPSSRPEKMDIATLKALTKTEESTALSKDLKKRGWSFVGPTTIYAFMQAMGMVNDHLGQCVCHERIQEARATFIPPL